MIVKLIINMEENPGENVNPGVEPIIFSFLASSMAIIYNL